MMRNTTHHETDCETRREMPSSPGRPQPAGRRSGRASGPGIMRRLAGSIDARVCIVIAILLGMLAVVWPVE